MDVDGAKGRGAVRVGGDAIPEAVSDQANEALEHSRREEMRIAVSSEGTELSARVDSRFGRTKWFILYDTDTGEFESISNEQVLNLPQGAGIQAAQHLVNHNVDVVLTGHCGPNAFRTLAAAGVEVVLGASGTVGEVVKQFQEGGLKTAKASDVEGHW